MLVRLNMDILLLILVSVAISAFLKAFFSLFFDSKTIIHNQLPPGPPPLPLIGNVFWLYTPISKLESHIRSLHAKFGPIITIHLVSRPFIMVADRFIAYKALIQNGATFADRPAGAIAAARVLDKSQNSISSSPYGPTLRLLRGNLATGIFHPSRVKAQAHARKRVLQTLQNRLELLSKSGEPIQVLEHLQLAMYSLLAQLCFGDKLSQKQMEEIEEVEHRATLHLSNISIFDFWKSFSKIVLRKRRAWSLKIRKDQEDVFIPLIRERKKLKEERSTKSNMEDQDYVLSYVDTLLDLRFPANHDKIQLTERDILSLCNEFLSAGAGTTTTALEWILANLVKYPEIQEKLFMEIKGVVRDGDQGVKEDDLQEMPYLKAIILEGLRRHPPTHVSLPHAVTEDTTLNEYLVPKQGTVVFMLASIGWDPNSWEDCNRPAKGKTTTTEKTTVAASQVTNSGGGTGEEAKMYKEEVSSFLSKPTCTLNKRKLTCKAEMKGRGTYVDGWEEKRKAASDHQHADIEIRTSGDEQHVALEIKKDETAPNGNQARNEDRWQSEKKVNADKANNEINT